MTLLDPRRHAPIRPANNPARPDYVTTVNRPATTHPYAGGAITSNAGGSVFVLPHATRAHLAELAAVLRRAMDGRR